MVLTFITPDMNNAVLLALTVLVIGNVAFEVALVFYNAFLPSIVTQDRIGRVSGYGWGLGYAGGLVCMAIGLVFFVGFPEPPGLLGISQDNALHVRTTNLLVAAWVLLFSIPIFLFVRDEPKASTGIDFRGALRDLKQTFQAVRRYKQIVRFLFARLIYNDGLVTIFAFGGIYAAGTFNMSNSEVLQFGIVLNVAAGLGALAFGFLDDKIGGTRTVLVSLVALCVATLIAVTAPTKAWLLVAGILIGLFVGPNQSASRSLMGRFVPERHQAEFFGFFAFSGKATAFLGPLFLGILSGAFGQRVGMSVVILFFVVGGALLLGVNERAGIEAARS